MDEHEGFRDRADVERGTGSGDDARATGVPDPDLQELERLEHRLRDLEQQLVGAEHDEGTQ